MTMQEWTKEIYDKTVTSEYWWFTPYDKNTPSYWEYIKNDEEMRSIAAMELSLDAVPEWVRFVGINYLPPCGLYNFPKSLLQVLSLIDAAGMHASEQAFRYGCYSVDRNRKKTAQDYCLCLDAWLAGTTPDVPAAELEVLGHRKIDWSRVCTDLWQVLGERNEKKELLVERLLVAIRFSVKASRWHDERGTEFGRDQYLGDFIQTPDGDASFKVNSSPRVKHLENKLSALDTEWHRLIRTDLGFWWLCAPKAFRFLECDLWTIGKDRQPEKDEEIPGFLQCEDTYPNQEKATAWYAGFCAVLDEWSKGNQPKGSPGALVSQHLGNDTPVKRWLVRLFLKKLRMYEATGASIGILVNPTARQKWGTKPIEI